ncbi:SDR family NAD(P)-dependent oxidoreductase [Halobaculum sp. MBLA0147]|uniref:SDR family NAD(P)-dependent oxidoreductase n=1 Tax=Halobaculum sp. MBLA0147 TaxID=3079934 RepID=UPI0035238998
MGPDDPLLLDDDRFHGGNVCLVTGAASGIGRAVALVAAANGLTVVGGDVDESGLAETSERVDGLGFPGQFHGVVADLAEQDDVERLAERAREAGTITYLANVAGLQHVAPIESFPTEQFDRLHDVMVRAPFLLSRAVVPDLRAADHCGAIANMASVHGHYVTSDKVAYNVAKFGVRGLTNSLAAESDGDFRAFSVSTGYVKTPLVVDQIPETARQRGISVDEVVEDVMLGQARATELMEPVEVANQFLYGFSEHAAHLNGTDLRHDDGMVDTYE